MRQFPYESIQGAARRFADTYCQYLESPWEFLAMGYLTILGSLISSQVTIDSAIQPQPRLYTALIGTSGDTRKSETIRQIEMFYKHALSCIKLPYSLNTSGAVGSAEGLAKELKASRNLLLSYDELKSFVSKCQIDTSILLPSVCSLFNRNEYHNATKDRIVDFSGAYLSIIGGCTDETYRKMWTSTFTDIGFINRIFIVPGYGERKYAIPKVVPDHELEELISDLSRILTLIHNRYREGGILKLPVKPMADSLYTQWYLEQESSEYTKRTEDYGLRLLILFAINELDTEINPRIVNQVRALLDWQIEVREEYAPADTETLSAKIEGAIRFALRKGPLTKRDLERMAHKYRYGNPYWPNTVSSMLRVGDLGFDEKTKLYRIVTNSVTIDW